MNKNSIKIGVIEAIHIVKEECDILDDNVYEKLMNILYPILDELEKEEKK